MKEFVIIAGAQNSGKTTTAWCVYQRLLPYSNVSKLSIFGREVENHGEIVYKAPPYDKYPEDFKAILHINDYYVSIISAGDYVEDLKCEIDAAYSDSDFIVISLRSYNRSGSSRRMFNETYPKDYSKEFWVADYAHGLTHPSEFANSKRPVADKIADYILFQTINK